jgi:hypothetical protein
LDAKGDGRQWIELQVSPYNVTFEQLATLTTDPVSDSNLILDSNILNQDWWTDPSWDIDGLQTASRILRSNDQITGWVIDVALPAKPILRRLGLSKYQPMSLRANFLRVEWPFKPETTEREFISSDWSPTMLGCPHLSPQAMGYLDLQAGS